MKRIRVALVGMGFGAEFYPIYLHHPHVERIAACDPNPEQLAKIADRYRIEDRYCNLDDVLADPSIDAVHLVTPIPLHAQQALAVLNAGKHCACTVPMATRLEDIEALVEAVRRTGRTYMMMETAVYTREFLYAKALRDSGELGRIQFLRGAHYQDMENWPPYWDGLPPMHYATHAISPVLALADCRATRVHCLGSGSMRPQLHEPYGNPFPCETAIFRLEREDLAAEITRTMFEIARDYVESFNVLGDKAGFEWQQLDREESVVFRMDPLKPGRGRPISYEKLKVPDYAHRLPEPIQRFTYKGVYDDSDPHLSFLQGGGHGGSHPHLVHEFVMSIVEGRKPWIDEIRSADWTAPGIVAHESAMRGGEGLDIPSFG